MTGYRLEEGGKGSPPPLSIPSEMPREVVLEGKEEEEEEGKEKEEEEEEEIIIDSSGGDREKQAREGLYYSLRRIGDGRDMCGR